MFCDYNGRKHYSAKGRSLIGVEQQAVKKQDKKSRDGLQAIWNDENNQRKEHKGSCQNGKGMVLWKQSDQRTKGGRDGLSALPSKEGREGVAQHWACHDERKKQVLRAAESAGEIDGQRGF